MLTSTARVIIMNIYIKYIKYFSIYQESPLTYFPLNIFRPCFSIDSLIYFSNIHHLYWIKVWTKGMKFTFMINGENTATGRLMVEAPVKTMTAAMSPEDYRRNINAGENNDGG